jgi:hypothetical protein
MTTALSQLEQESVIRNLRLNEALRELHELKRNIILNENTNVIAEQQIYGKVHVFFSHLRWDSPGKGTGKTRLFIKHGKLIEK